MRRSCCCSSCCSTTRPIVTRRRGAAFTRLFRGAARLLIHGARLRSPLLPRRLSQRRRPQRRPELLCSLKPQRGLASLQPLQRVQTHRNCTAICGREVARVKCQLLGLVLHR